MLPKIYALASIYRINSEVKNFIAVHWTMVSIYQQSRAASSLLWPCATGKSDPKISKLLRSFHT